MILELNRFSCSFFCFFFFFKKILVRGCKLKFRAHVFVAVRFSCAVATAARDKYVSFHQASYCKLFLIFHFSSQILNLKFNVFCQLVLFSFFFCSNPFEKSFFFHWFPLNIQYFLKKSMKCPIESKFAAFLTKKNLRLSYKIRTFSPIFPSRLKEKTKCYF